MKMTASPKCDLPFEGRRTFQVITNARTMLPALSR